MGEEAEDDRDAGHDGPGDIGGPPGLAGHALKHRDKDRHASQTEKHGRAIDAYTTNPLGKIVIASLEDEPFVAKECNGNCDEAG